MEWQHVFVCVFQVLSSNGSVKGLRTSDVGASSRGLDVLPRWRWGSGGFNSGFEASVTSAQEP